LKGAKRPEGWVERFTSVVQKKLTSKVDLEAIIEEEEGSGKLALHR
jgi:hypothetical protein